MRRRNRGPAAPNSATVTSDFVRHMLDVCKRAAAGDLEARVEYREGLENEGDLVSLRNELNRLLDRTDGFVRESGASLQSASEGRYYRQFLLAGMLGSFRSSAVTINAARRSMSAGAQRDVAATEQRLRLADEFEDTVMAIAEQVAAAATEMSASTAGLIEASRSAVSEADQAKQTVQTLEDSSRKIQQVVTVISQVASQTRLLALNATIEAARAGEIGKGFAVVASEVKDLADQTERATNDIVERVKSVQGVAVLSGDVMGRIGDTVREMGMLTDGLAVAVDGRSGHSAAMAASLEDGAAMTGLAEMAETLRAESDRFLAVMRTR